MPNSNQSCKKLKSRIGVPRKGSRSRRLRGAPHKKGVCMKITTMKPKKPNSAIRKIAKVCLSNGSKITGYIHGRGHDLKEYPHVLVRGGGVPDLPGVRYHFIKGKYDSGWKERRRRKTSRSKYGIPRNHAEFLPPESDEDFGK